MNALRIRVPATTANLGPGFDTLGLALNLHNEVHVESIEEGLEIVIEGEGEEHLPRDASNLIARAAYRFFRVAGIRAPGLRIRSVNRIPRGSGLGSSAAAVLCGLMAADQLAGTETVRDQLLALAADMEGHADNAAAALYGGLTIVGHTSSGLKTAQVSMAPMQFAVVVPEIKLSTRQMRFSLPQNVTLKDAALNLGRSALVVEALRHGDFDLLAAAADDRLHEPYRGPQIPGFADAKAAGLEAGASAVTLSGAGPGVIAFAPSNHENIASAMADRFEKHGLTVRKFALEPEPHGAQVLPPNH